MARPVVKWFGSAGLDNLRKRIRPFGTAVGQDGDPRVSDAVQGLHVQLGLVQCLARADEVVE